jgi:predicted nucleic acid-binding protein
MRPEPTVIYLDSSVVLAEVFAESRTPPEALWHQELVSSQLLEYEVWNRVNARGWRGYNAVRALFTRIYLLELDAARLARALEPFPVAVRTLDSLHLATIEHMRRNQPDVELASFDRRMIAAARALGIRLYQV